MDWEANREIFAHRLALVQRGLGIEPHPVPYRKMLRPLHEEIGEVRRSLNHYKAGLVIADSFIMGCGSDPETADAATRFFTPLSALTPGVTPIAINHVSRASMAITGRRSPYGSIAGEGIVRSAWEARRSDQRKGRGRVCPVPLEGQRAQARTGYGLPARL